MSKSKRDTDTDTTVTTERNMRERKLESANCKSTGDKDWRQAEAEVVEQLAISSKRNVRVALRRRASFPASRALSASPWPAVGPRSARSRFAPYRVRIGRSVSILSSSPPPPRCVATPTTCQQPCSLSLSHTHTYTHTHTHTHTHARTHAHTLSRIGEPGI